MWDGEGRKEEKERKRTETCLSLSVAIFVHYTSGPFRLALLMSLLFILHFDVSLPFPNVLRATRDCQNHFKF